MRLIIDTEKYPISLYSIFLVSSLLIGFLVAVILMRKLKVRKDALICSAFLNIVLIIQLSLTYTYVIGLFEGREVFGFSSMGAVIGLLLGSFFTSRLFKEPHILKAFSAVLPLIYAISKLGCFFAGCCGGIEYHGFGAVTYLGSKDFIRDCPTLPVPMLETIAFTIIFIIVILLFNKLDLKKHITLNALLCALAKGLLDFLRYSHVNQVISINQIFCILVAVTVLLIAYVIPKPGKKTSL